MTVTDSAFLEKAIRSTDQWLADLARELDWRDRRRVYRALRVTLQNLRDRLPIEEAAQLGAQLPLLLRGVYYEGWSPTKAAKKKLNRKEFLAALDGAFWNDLDFDAESVCHAVFSVIERHVSGGENRDVEAVLPKGLKEIWAQAGVAVGQGR